MVWGKQAVQKLTESCWQCGRRLKAEQTICMACGAVRVPEDLAPKLAIPTNGWYEPTEPFHIPTRFGHASSRPVTEEEAHAAGEKVAQAHESAFPPPVAPRAYTPSQPMERSPEEPFSLMPTDIALERTLESSAEASAGPPLAGSVARQQTSSQPLRGVAAWIRGLIGGEQDETYV
ncbi:MAG: hypothetical protein ACRDHP_08610 [Ktedonobacterales bacterium]